jgi:DNA processing protein
MTVDQEKLFRARTAIELSLIPGIGNLSQGKLWKAHPRLEQLPDLDGEELSKLGLTPDAVTALCGRRFRPMAEEILDWARREQCRILIRGEADYPLLLNEIYDPPLVLYCRGQMEILSKACVAVVGTRRPTFYGLQAAQGLAYDLAKRGVTIVSGLARGIDAAAHRGCLEAGGRTAAVLGCGIDIVYPREHRQLMTRIGETGAVLSEFPPGTSPAPQNFPVRNRIISGLSLGTVIVEAREYSGSLITARLAMEQNREVFAVPGNLTSPQSFGPNFLIKQGAKLVQVWRDIIEEMPPGIRHQILAHEDAPPKRSAQLDLITEQESPILELLAADKATQFDRVLHGSGLRVPELSELLLNLEMRGLIRQVPGNLFIKVARRSD